MSVRYSGKLPESSTVDDVEGILGSLIPSGMYLSWTVCMSEYVQKICRLWNGRRSISCPCRERCYILPSIRKLHPFIFTPCTKHVFRDKQRRVWSVSCKPQVYTNMSAWLSVIGYVRRSRFQRISQKDADIYVVICRGRLVYQRRGGWLGIRGTVCDLLFSHCTGRPWPIPADSKNGSGGTELRRITLWVIHRCIIFTVSQKECGCDWGKLVYSLPPRPAFRLIHEKSICYPSAVPEARPWM